MSLALFHKKESIGILFRFTNLYVQKHDVIYLTELVVLFFNYLRGANVKNKFFAGLVFSSFILITSCQNKEKKEIVYIPTERKADKNVAESFGIAKDNGHLEIKKSAIGKAYILTPYARSSARAAQWLDYKPLIVSFEKKGNIIGVFNLTYAQLYSQIQADKMVDSFEIVSESDESYIINLKGGFKSLPLTESLSIVEPQSVKELGKQVEENISSGLEIKNSVLSDLQIKPAQIEITQNILISSQVLLENEIEYIKDNKVETHKTSSLKTLENNLTLYIDLKPYEPTKGFDSLSFDTTQTYGYFVNFLSKSGDSQLTAQFVKWDTNKTISVYVSQNTPKEVLPIIKQSVEYWNSALKKSVFKFVEGHSLGARPEDYSIQIRWIDWDDAGFAYAGIQADPLTGEIYRGQVFMTSSWFKMFDIIGGIPIESEQNLQIEKLNNQLIKKYSICHQQVPRIESSMLSMSAEQKEQKTLDVIRYVFTHELGHVVGLRHNFIASSSRDASDTDLWTSIAKYMRGEDVSAQIPASTSVMDYFGGSSLPYIGRSILNGPLAYDLAAIESGYLKKPFSLNKDRVNYCSDEHIMVANSLQKNILDCERQDSFSNVFFSKKVQIVNYYKNIVASNLINIVNAEFYNKNKLYYSKEGLEDSIVFYIPATIPSEAIYATSQKQFISAETAKDYFNMSLQGFSLSSLFSQVQNDKSNVLTKMLNESGGLSELLKVYMIPYQQENFLMSKADEFFAKNSAESLKISPTLYEDFKLAFYKAINRSTFTQYYPFISSFLPHVRENLKAGEEPKSVKFREDLSLGNIDELFSFYKKVILNKSFVPKKAKWNGKSVEVYLSQGGMSGYEVVKNAYKIENWNPVHKQILEKHFGENLKSAKEQLYKESVASLQILATELFQEQPKSWKYADVASFFYSRDWSQVEGLKIQDLQEELIVFNSVSEELDK